MGVERLRDALHGETKEDKLHRKQFLQLARQLESAFNELREDGDAVMSRDEDGVTIELLSRSERVAILGIVRCPVRHRSDRNPRVLARVTLRQPHQEAAAAWERAVLVCEDDWYLASTYDLDDKTKWAPMHHQTMEGPADAIADLIADFVAR